MILSNHQLLFIGVGTELDDLHTVKQWTGYGIQGVGSGDEHDVGQVEGNLQIVIPVGMILLGIQNLQQGRAGVTTIVRTHLIDFIQQKDRVGGARLGNGRHDSAGHGTHIGLPMASDVRLVVDTTQGNANHLSIQTLGNGIGDGGLAHTGRAHQAENLGRHMGRQLPDGNGLQNSLLHLFQAEMVMLQNLGGCLDIQTLLGRLIPGQIKHSIQIAPEHGSLRRAKGLLSQLLQILQKLFFVFFFQVEALDFGHVLVKVLVLLPFSQLIPDDPHLFPEIVVPLILVDGGAGLILNLGLQLEHFNFSGQVSNGQFQPSGGIELQQELGLLFKIQAGILGNGICHKAVLVAGQHPKLHHLGRMLTELHISIIKRTGLPTQGFSSWRIGLLRAGNGLHNGAQIGLCLPHFHNSGPGHAGDQHPQIFLRGVQELLYPNHRTHGI